MERQSGILMPVFSLPSKYGIGSFGKEGYNFIDFLVQAKQGVWQILPLVQTGYGNSPYSSIDSSSFNPYFISLELLKEEGLLKACEIKEGEYYGKYIDYGFLYNSRFPLLRKAFSRFDKNGKEFKKFVKNAEYKDYALFMAIKIKTNYKNFYEWEDGLKYRDDRALNDFLNDNKEEYLFWQFVQFTAKKQWLNLKVYANKNGIKIMGDMPLYVALDSVDVWVNPSLFKLDENFIPKKVAGVPPDYFSRTGQLWGNPVYDYDNQISDNFCWWTNRIKRTLTIFDLVRIDHFRGLDRYYQVDYGAKDATVGEWVKVPSRELFDAIHIAIDGDRIIAEDLGIIDDGVRELLKYTGYPGMKILSFAFNGESGNLYLPERIEENSVCYTGTHDNDTLKGLINNSSEWDYNNLINGVSASLIKAKIKKDVLDKNTLFNAIIELGFYSKAKLFIMPFQDVLGLNSDYRINEPGTVKEQNWAIRFSKQDFKKSVALSLAKLVTKYKR